LKLPCDIKLKFQFDVQTDKLPQNEALNIMKIEHDSRKNYTLVRAGGLL
jgi:hypothetical protein